LIIQEYTLAETAVPNLVVAAPWGGVRRRFYGRE
jgi:hypothetical protein